jgi:hypothetical protein
MECKSDVFSGTADHAQLPTVKGQVHSEAYPPGLRSPTTILAGLVRTLCMSPRSAFFNKYHKHSFRRRTIFLEHRKC